MSSPCGNPGAVAAGTFCSVWKADFCSQRDRKIPCMSAGRIGYFSFPGEILPWSSPCLSLQIHRLPGVCRWLFALFTLSLCQHGFRVWDRKGCPRLFCLSLLPLPTCSSFTEKGNKDAGLKLSSSHMQA